MRGIGIDGVTSMGIFDYFKNKTARPAGRAADGQRGELLRHYEILKDCEDMVNHSANFSVVVSRFDRLLDELGYFASFDAFGPDYLMQYGITFKTAATDLWHSTFQNRAAILSAAVDRILDLEIDAALELKTKSGQENRMLSYVNKIQNAEGVPADVLKYVAGIPVLDALREPAVVVTCRACGNEFRARPHAYKGYFVDCPKCGQRLRADTSKR